MYHKHRCWICSKLLMYSDMYELFVKIRGVDGRLRKWLCQPCGEWLCQWTIVAKALDLVVGNTPQTWKERRRGS